MHIFIVLLQICWLCWLFCHRWYMNIFVMNFLSRLHVNSFVTNITWGKSAMDIFIVLLQICWLCWSFCHRRCMNIFIMNFLSHLDVITWGKSAMTFLLCSFKYVEYVDHFATDVTWTFLLCSFTHSVSCNLQWHLHAFFVHKHYMAENQLWTIYCIFCIWMNVSIMNFLSHLHVNSFVTNITWGNINYEHIGIFFLHFSLFRGNESSVLLKHWRLGQGKQFLA